MRVFLAFLRLDLRHLRRDRASLFWMAVMPFAFMAFFGTVFSGPGEPIDAVLVLRIRDLDRTETSRGVVALIDTTRFRLSAEEDPSASPVRTLTIPAAFEDSVLAGVHADLLLTRHGGTDTADFAARAALFRTLLRFHGALATAAPDSSTWSDSTRAVFRGAVSREPAFTVREEWASSVQTPSGFLQSVPGNLAMFVLMSTVMATAALLADERRSGVLRRLASQPVPMGAAIAGKAASRFLISLAQIALLLVGSRLLFGFRPDPSPFAFLAVAAVFSLGCVALGLLLGSLFRTPERAAGAAWLTSMLMAALGGAWWPLEVVPNWMRTAAHAFPIAWAMDGFHAITTGGGGWAEVALPIAVLAGFAVVSGVVASFVLRPER